MSSTLKNVICAFVLAGGSVTAVAQNLPAFEKTVDFLPPAPNAAAIVKYGEASVNRNQGTPNVSIPLFTVKGLKLSAPVSIGYGSSGLKVDELASRVGAGWAINAGGVITRTVRGLVDENNYRHYPYATVGVNFATYNYMRRIATSSPNGGYDAEPDLFNFSFNGYSGSFVLDYYLNPVQINKSGLKIERNTGSTTTWHYKITTPDGIMYFFGGSTATESTKRTQTCGKSYNSFIPTSWYLKEIQHPNGEKIELAYTSHTYEYDNGVSQTMSNAGVSGLLSGCNCANTVAPTNCINISQTNGVLLQSITSPGISSVDFYYTTRPDCNDKLVTNIIYRENGVNAGAFAFNYETVTSSSAYNRNTDYPYTGADKTPYLKSLQQSATGNADVRTHYFSYMEPEARPWRMSYAQDHWGYFNGKNNTTLLPVLHGWNDVFTDATANREPDFSFAQKGLLQKIVYPTGGVNMLFYEANKASAPTMYEPRHKLSCDVTGTGDWNVQTKSLTFQITNANSTIAKLKVHCRVNDNSVPPFNHHNKGNVEIVDLSNNMVVFQKNYSPTQELTDVVYFTGSGNYKITIDAAGTMLTTLAELNYLPVSNTGLEPVTVGGARVSKITTSNPGEAPMVKKYYYSFINDLNTSSLVFTALPQYVGETRNAIVCNSDEYICVQSTINSSSLFNMGLYNNSPVSYSAVVEGIGENFEGGATETQFSVMNDGLGFLLYGKDIIHSPFNNYSSYSNGKVNAETIFKKNGLGAFVPVKKTKYEYNLNLANETVIAGFSVVLSNAETGYMDTTCNLAYNPSDPLSCLNLLTRVMSKYSMMKYYVLCSWVQPEYEIQTLYDENGLNPVVTSTKSFYETSNISHYQVTKKEVEDSKGQVTQTTFKYPKDYAGTGDYNDMISKNIIAVPVAVKEEIISTPSNISVSEAKINYAHTGNNNYSPVSFEKSVKGNALEVEGTISQYDDKGNILEFTGKNEVVNAIIWGYNYQYPVAKITGASYSTAVAQLGVTMTALQSLDGSALRSALNAIRTGLPNAQVTTYTYKPLTGVTSITDANGRTNTYEYDGYKQLLIVRDQDGNTVKKNEYVYAVPDANASVPVFFNAVVTQSITPTSCIAGYSSPAVSYTIPFGKYHSFISQADADSKAATDLATLGLEFANRNASCSNSADCANAGPGYKFINCACELGTKVCESSTAHPTLPGYYNNVYHWLWSDGSISAGFLELMPPCTGADKKKIDCNCVTGTRVCDNVVDNGGGSYTVTYHYHFPDNTNSSTFVENITGCTGDNKKLINCECKTGVKFYVSSVACGKNNPPPGCCTGMWLCSYYYNFGQGIRFPETGYLTECSAEPCTPSELQQ